MTKRLIPCLNRVLIEKIVPPSKTTGGILLPETSSKLNSGKVVAVGPGTHEIDLEIQFPLVLKKVILCCCLNMAVLKLSSVINNFVKPAVNFVKKWTHLLEFSVDHEGFAKCRLRTESFPSLRKLLKKPSVRVAVGDQGTTYFIPIPGISVEDDEVNMGVFSNKLFVFANRGPAKAGGGIAYRYWVPLPKGFTMDDLTIAHVNGEMKVFVPYQKKEELVS